MAGWDGWINEGSKGKARNGEAEEGRDDTVRGGASRS